MKLLLDIKDNKAEAFIELIKSYSYIKAQPISLPDAELFAEIKEIKNAFKNVERMKSGKLKVRPVDDLLKGLS